MSLVKSIQNQAIDDLMQSLKNEYDLRWVPCSCSELTKIRPSRIDNVYYATLNSRHDFDKLILVRLGSSEECTPALVSEFARIYSLSPQSDNDLDQFKRYSTWISYRNKFIIGFTKHEDNYYMAAYRKFYRYYSRYGFCSACGIFRCSPVWCICGHQGLSDGWTSKNEQLDKLIKKSQMQTRSANEAYLEWIPSSCIQYKSYGSETSLHKLDIHKKLGYGHGNLYCLPCDGFVRLIPLEVTDETDDSYYDEFCEEHPYILNRDVWIAIGFTYDAIKQKYYLMKTDMPLCLACTYMFEYVSKPFCDSSSCKAPRLLKWTTGNKLLDQFIMESWKNADECDAYIQWIEYRLLSNVQEMTSLHHECTHIADWLETGTNISVKVILKQIVDGWNAQSFDFYKLVEEYSEILTPDNIWVVGITQEPSTQEYYLVLYHDIHAILDRVIPITMKHVKFMQYADFDEIKEIGSGDYGTVHIAKYKKYLMKKLFDDYGRNYKINRFYYSEDADINMQKVVVLKHFKYGDQMLELFITELRNHARCASFGKHFLQIYGVTQDPGTKEYIIIMQYANNGDLWSYLDQNINRLTWKMKLECLKNIASCLSTIHKDGLVHCNLHGGNIVVRDYDRSFICDLRFSRSVNSHGSNPTIRGVLPFIAPEVFHDHKFTLNADKYSFGIIMYLMATGEPPFRDRQFNRNLLCDIMDGLRPRMPDSAPEEYKKLAQHFCDADPDKRPSLYSLQKLIQRIEKMKNKKHRSVDLGSEGSGNDSDSGNDLDLNNDMSIWDTIYYNDVRPLSHLAKERKYSSKILPTTTRDLPKPRNTCPGD